ncbi:MAG TPA: hypothetical protein VMM60_16655 [Ilumatobacter sp.]|nr:hypothetical protein [Ilumatobacter sp.]
MLIVSDTGFLLSIASTKLLLPIIRERWQGHAAWPTDVLSELQHIDRQSRSDVPAGLAQAAIRCGQALGGAPVSLDDQQRDRAEAIAALLGGTVPGQHIGESAGAILAIDGDGLLVSDDVAAFPVLQRAGARVADLRTVMFRLATDGDLTNEQVNQIIEDLNSRQRPHFEGLTAADIRNRRF